jgi:hypothetical protein
MQAFRPALSRQARLATRISPVKSYLKQPILQLRTRPARWQHQQHGPHKEYFQNPGQMPVPDTTPYNHGQPYIPKIEPTPPTPGAGDRSLFARFLRSLTWGLLFSLLGAAAGTGLITWEYLQPPFEPGSEEESELLEEIYAVLETHPLVDSLRQANWIENSHYINFRPDLSGPTSMHFVSENLQGTQGMTLKVFKHPTMQYTMLVAFLGFGIEGWPDVIHGGVITTLVQEAFDRHLDHFPTQSGEITARALSIDFKRKMRPGEVYAVLVPGMREGAWPGAEGVVEIVANAAVCRLEETPIIHPGGVVGFKPSDDIHALCKVHGWVIPDVTPERQAEIQKQLGISPLPSPQRMGSGLGRRPEQ